MHQNINYDFFKDIFTQEYLRSLSFKDRPEVQKFLRNNNGDRFFAMVHQANLMVDQQFYAMSETDFSRNIDVLNQGLKFINTVYAPSVLSLEMGLGFSYSPYSSEDILKAVVDRRSNMMINYYDKKTIPWLKSQQPEVVGISLSHMNQFIPGFTLAAMIKAGLDCKVVLGGSAVSQLCGYFLKLPKLCELFDFVIYGPGEYAMDGLLNKLELSVDVSTLPNLMYKKNNILHVSPNSQEFQLEDAEIPEYDDPRPKAIVALDTSANCYWGRCSFCDRGVSYGRERVSSADYKEVSIDKVVDALEVLQNKYNPLFVRLTDSAVPAARLHSLTSRIKERNLPIKLLAYIRAEKEFLSQELCQQLRAGGLIATAFGLESGSDEMNQKIKKGVRVDQVAAVLRNIKNAGIISILFSIIGFPNENIAGILQTESFIAKNRKNIDIVLISKFAFLLNTDMFQNSKSFGISEIRKPREQDIVRMFGYKDRSWLLTRVLDKLISGIIRKYPSPRNQLVLKALQSEYGGH